MPISTITAKGQVTIPKTIRDRLGLSEGDRLAFSIDENGRIVACLQHAAGICGILHDFAPKEPICEDDMKKVIRRRAADTVSRQSL